MYRALALLVVVGTLLSGAAASAAAQTGSLAGPDEQQFVGASQADPTATETDRVERPRTVADDGAPIGLVAAVVLAIAALLVLARRAA